ncbi:ABC-type transport system involved in multi-copper enzyme maturation permease subunit [Hamadaea flava]|uniref:ABC transporter permease n=1 Tax=Hamadaea flava TaxID=1742688 RepID=A0ABV8LQ52_9ACTN|nr:ABC transporter permease subunit [Hamadaea flava]MCP2322516.1 ABC-type transport system involved in multi-copper enzyme maturation permease subunit [Hamadaea flava]
MRLIRSEFLKIRTTNVWWLFVLGTLGLWAISFFFNVLQAHFVLNPEGVPDDQAATFSAMAKPAALTAYLATSGQYFGLMFVMLLGILTVTNEFHHQTATTTFLATPHRTSVIIAKTVAAAIFGFLLWLLTTILSVVGTVIFLNIENAEAAFGDSAVIRSILLNLIAFALWGLIGVGFGVLIRSQIGATVTALILYLVGTIAVSIIVQLLYVWLEQEWIKQLQWVMPSIASSLLVSGVDLPDQPHYWVGGLVLLAWAAVTGVIGTLITRNRDIS